MKKIYSAIFLCALSISLFAQNFYPDQVMVMLEYKKDINEVVHEFNKKHPDAGLKVKKVLSKRINIWLLEFDDKIIDHNEVVERMGADPNVAIAQLNHNNVELRGNPNDTYWNNQWDMSLIDAPLAWDITTGGLTANGDTIVVAVIDGGFDLNHEDLNFWKNYQEIPNNNIDDDNNGFIDDVRGWDAFGGDDNVMFSGSWDDHGTHVAGTVGAVGDNSKGVTGVNGNVKVMPISGSSGSESVVVEAYSFALEHRAQYNETNGASGAFVVSTNSSFGVDNGNPNNYPLWCAFYDTLGAYGIVSAGATANADNNVDVVGDIPTACSSDFMVAVTNTNSNDQKVTYAGYGLTTIDLGAPGDGIWSTTPNNGYEGGSWSGTSMATPHVAGAIGLMYAAACPEMLDAFKDNPAGLAMHMRSLLLNEGVDYVPNLCSITVTGGRLNLYKCLRAVQSNCIDELVAGVVTSKTHSECTNCTGTATVEAFGGTSPYSYQWNDPANQNTAQATGLCAGNYDVLITDADGYSTITKVEIKPHEVIPKVNAVNDVGSCSASDGGIFMTASGPSLCSFSANYNWSNGANSNMVNGLSAGIYTVTVSDAASGCSTVKQIALNGMGSPSITATSEMSCIVSGDGNITTTVTGGTSPYQYVWNNGETTQSIDGLPEGNYSLTVSDAGNCKAFLTYEVEQNAPIIGNLQAEYDDSASVGSIQATITGGTPPFSYLWSTGATIKSISGLAEGTYSLVVTDNNGCQKTFSETVLGTGNLKRQMKNEGLFSVFPNPSSGEINFQLQNVSKGEYKLSLKNMLGQEVYRESISVQSDRAYENKLQLNLESGVYFMEVKRPGESYLKKLILN